MVEEQGILESFFKLPQTERGIIRQLLEKCGPQQVGVTRLPVPFGPQEVKERRTFLLPVYKLIRYQAYSNRSVRSNSTPSETCRSAPVNGFKPIKVLEKATKKRSISKVSAGIVPLKSRTA
jgi:hypothetical protein